MSEQEQMKEVMSYLIGYRLGTQILPQMLPGITAQDLISDKLAKGAADGLIGDMDLSIVNEKVQQYQQEFIAILQKRSQDKSNANLELGRKYMEENGKKANIITTATGLQYEILTPGGSEKYTEEKYGKAPTAKVMYKGTLIDGTVFDQSPHPVEFNIRQVIPGFTEALTSMPIGAKWRVTIPAHLAYGANGPGSIGPNSTLIFEMELLGLTK